MDYIKYFYENKSNHLEHIHLFHKITYIIILSLYYTFSGKASHKIVKFYIFIIYLVSKMDYIIHIVLYFIYYFLAHIFDDSNFDDIFL